MTSPAVNNSNNPKKQPSTAVAPTLTPTQQAIQDQRDKSAQTTNSPPQPQMENVDPTPPKLNKDNGTPDWWLKYLINQLLARQHEFNIRKAYVDGEHPLPRGDIRYMRALKHLQDLATTNYVGLITTTPVERMQVRGFRFGDPGTADEDAASIWTQSNMDLQSHTINMNASKYGLAYALVSPGEEGDKWPRITAEDPRTSIVYRDPVNPTKSLAGLRMWEDEIVGRILAVVYLPEGAYGYVGPPIYETLGMTLQDVRERLLNQVPGNSVGAFDRSGFVPNPETAQEVALTEFVWRPETGPRLPQGEAGLDVRIIQDRINQTVFQRMCIAHFQAYKQRWATGISLPSDSGKSAKVDGNGRRKGPFDPGMDMIWVSKDPTSKFGEFASADITQILESIRDDVADIAALSKTPAHYLMGKMANISGETLTQAESGLVSKTQIRMSSMGWSYQRVMKLCFAQIGDDRANDDTSAVLWQNPGRELIADTALAGTQWQTIGVPLALIMEAQGIWTQDQIAFAVQYAEQQQQIQMEQQQQQMQMQHEQAMQLQSSKPVAGQGANTTAKPGAKPVANSNSKPAAKKAVGAKQPKPAAR